MEIPKRAYSDGLSDYEFRLLATLCLLNGSGGRFKASTAQLATLTLKQSEKSVRRALAALESKGYIRRTATKRANGRRGIDYIEVLSEVDKNVRTSHD